MSLGERIYRLRTEKSLSQGDLAEKLNVSRQSISKWENNSAVPDLEKIVKLSEVFDVTLDELVKGETKQREGAGDIQVSERQEQESPFPPRKIAGTILLCMGFLVVLVCCFLTVDDWLAGLLFASPFLVCGVICFAFKKNVGLWCAWAVYLLFDIYMSYATGISRASVRYTFQWTYEMNFVRLAFAWILFLSLAAMIAVTVFRFYRLPIATDRKGRNRILIAWAVVILLQIIAMLWPRTVTYRYILTDILSIKVKYKLVMLLLSWSRIIAFTVALVNTVRYVRSK